MSSSRAEVSRDDASQRLEGMQMRCREAGLRLTIQRRAVMKVLLDFNDHPTAEQTFDRVHQRLPGISRATVFRILEQFVASQIIGRACHPGRSARYDSTTELHHHLICLRCESMIDVFDDSLDSIPIPDTAASGFEIVDFRVQMHGFCSRCRQQRKKEDTK